MTVEEEMLSGFNVRLTCLLPYDRFPWKFIMAIYGNPLDKMSYLVVIISGI